MSLQAFFTRLFWNLSRKT